MLFIVCGTTADDPVQQQQVIHNNLGRTLSRFGGIYFLPGRCIPSKLSWKDRFLLKIGVWLEKDSEKKAAMKKGFDKMDRKNLDQLLAGVRELTSI